MSEKVVVAGAGFGGVHSALELAQRGYDVELIDKDGYHLFTPALIYIARGSMEAEDISMNLNDFFSDTSVEFSREKIVGIDPDEEVVETTSGAHSYDNLVVSLGYDIASFGIDISDALEVYTLEGAKKVDREAEEAESALIVGSGYVGVEVACELRERGIEVTLVDRSTGPMPRSSKEVSEKVLESLNSRDISFRGGQAVEEVNEDGIVLENGERIEAEMVVWLAGMQSSELVQRDFNCGRSGIEVNSGLNSHEYSNVFALGSCADAGCEVTAYNAIGQAETIAENIGRADNKSLKEFEEGARMLLMKMGDTAILEYGDKSYKNSLLRHMKKAIRWKYWSKLKWKRLRLRF
ncbi:MAG: hypothetical protein BRC29_04585 [Nanohaloarchaea archaeon SW_7_43_1]|nr:MAG: hypothetical protein BRC29_04585 [Nanohaloarchaea archaeon SW_7_43_1]